MIGQQILDDSGNLLIDRKSLSLSAYQPPTAILELFQRVQKDYGVGWRLQHRPFREFDGKSLLERDRVDLETFAAYVGAQYVPQHKQWRWRGRKNTARNKIIGILAHIISGILYPYVQATNQDNEDDETAGECATILLEDHLKKAKYDMRFMSMALSALARPAVIVNTEWVTALQTIKQKAASGMKISEVVDELFSGLQLHIIPVDEFIIGDFYTGEVQQQPYIIRVRRISYDHARKIYGKEKNFKYVQAGKTRIVFAGQSHQSLFDIEWTEADQNFVQEITAFYRADDIQVTFLGGVFIGDEEDPMNTNPFEHRRMTMLEDGTWITAPIYPFAKSGFEHIDPSGRFFYYKSAAFKEYWDDATQNEMHSLFVNGAKLEVFKPMFISGIAKVDSAVIAPSAVVAMPAGAQATPYDLRSNLGAAMNALKEQEGGLSDSTIAPIMTGQLGSRQTAMATSVAQANAKIMLGLISFMIADLVKQVGELSLDLVIAHVTVGQLDASTPEALSMKFKTILSKGQRQGTDVTHKIIFSTAMMGRTMTPEQIEAREWELYNMRGATNEARAKSKMHIWEVNPYSFARNRFAVYVDGEKIINGSLGLDRTLKDEAFNKFANPLVWPFIDQKQVVKDFVVDEYAKGNPDKYMNENAQPQGMPGMPPGGAPSGPPGMTTPSQSLASSLASVRH